MQYIMLVWSKSMEIRSTTGCGEHLLWTVAEQRNKRFAKTSEGSKNSSKNSCRKHCLQPLAQLRHLAMSGTDAEKVSVCVWPEVVCRWGGHLRVCTSSRAQGGQGVLRLGSSHISQLTALGCQLVHFALWFHFYALWPISQLVMYTFVFKWRFWCE
jgi:hypothetical protein